MALPVKCLLVDDREENLLALSALLESDDVELLLAGSGTEALELLLVHEVALALLDVQMPEMDGFELAELMRGSERTRHIPIIFVTAGAHDRYRVFRGYESGAVDFLHKPIEPHALRNKAAVFFELYRQRRQLAQELQERTETLRFNEMFSAVLGHDLRGPLSAVIMSATVLGHRATDESSKAAAGRIVASGKRMSRMIDDMNDLARARLAGGFPLERADDDVAAIAERIVVEQRTAAPGRTIEFESKGDCAGVVDASRLEQVCANLIGNAVRHGEPSQPVEVAVDGRRPESVELTVRNAGVIPSELLPHIFDPFRSGRPNGHAREGLGIGLYIVREIVRAHSGEIDVTSADDAGTTFRVVLPRAGTGENAAR